MALILDADERFDKAKALHHMNEWKQPSTLQNLCHDIFINRADVIISGWKKSGENIFELLPHALRNDLLSYLPSRAIETKLSKEQFLDLLYLLMNEETYKLEELFEDFPFDDDIHPDELQRSLAIVAEKSPQLTHFGIAFYVLDNSLKLTENLVAPRENIPHLFELNDLMHLEIFGFWFWKNEDLNLLFLKMKQLVFLKICVHKTVTIDGGFQNIHLMKKLEEFHFDIDTGEETGRGDSDEPLVTMFEEIYSFCAENVPSLKLIGGNNEDFVNGDFVLYATEFADISPLIRGTSGLEQLLTNSVLPSADFPNLQNLLFHGPLSMDQEMFCGKMASFTRLRILYLDDLSYGDIIKMLEFVGKQLESLYVIFQDYNFDFYRILHLCPNLSTFIQYMYDTDDEANKVDQQSEYQALVTKHNVRLLNYFRASLRKGEKVEGLLELILFAPLLEDLLLYNLTVTRAVCQSVHGVLEGHFLHLGQVYLSCLDLDTSCAIGDFGLFVQFLVCSAPSLYKLNLFWKDNSLKQKWESEQTFAIQFQHLLQQYN